MKKNIKIEKLTKLKKNAAKKEILGRHNIPTETNKIPIWGSYGQDGKSYNKIGIVNKSANRYTKEIIKAFFILSFRYLNKTKKTKLM